MRRELVQVSLPSSSTAGSTKACFADTENGTVEDLIKTLLEEDGQEIVQEISCVDEPFAVVDKLDVSNWGIQRVTLSEPNRRWSDEELLALDQSIALFDNSVPLSTVLPSCTGDNAAKMASSDSLLVQRPPSRNLSDFSLTAHLQVPLIRLVYSPYRIQVTFTHVPEMPEDFKLHWFIGGNMTAMQVIDAILDELGIRKIVTQGSKSARVEYSLNVNGEVLPTTNSVIPYLKQQGLSSPFPVSLSISDAWYSRIGTVAKSFSRALQRPSLGTVTSRRQERQRERDISADSSCYSTMTTPSAWRPASIFNSLWQSPTSHHLGDDSQDTIRADQDENDDASARHMQEEEEEGEGTLKGLEQASSAKTRPTPPIRATTRLSSLFDVWSQPVATVDGGNTADLANRIRMVSEPIAVDDFRRASTLNLDIANLRNGEGENGQQADLSGFELEPEFELMMDQLGIKENQRVAMRKMDEQRKRFLIEQQRQKSTGMSTIKAHHTGPEQRPNHRQSTSSSASPVLALSGLKRFSLWSTSSSIAESSSAPQSPEMPSSPVESDTASILSFASQASNAQSVDTHSPPAPLLQTATGWSSWFSAGSPAKPTYTTSAQVGKSVNKATPQDTPTFYINQIQQAKLARNDLAKLLIALRVRLATAALSWIQDFLQQNGLAALEKVLRTFTQKTAAAEGRDAITEMDEAVQTESIRCLRIILNTEIGFDQVLARASIVTQVTYSLYTNSNKLRALVADVLAALCVLSAKEGHKLVLHAFADFKVAYSEDARFEYLVRSISVRDDDEQSEEIEHEVDDERLLWEYRAAGLALINSIVNTPDDLDERISLRGEFTRRGLNESMVTLKYLNPPDALLTQLTVYLEEKQEDHEELRLRRTEDAGHAIPAAHPELTALVDDNPGILPRLVVIGQSLAKLPQQHIEDPWPETTIQVVASFIEHVCRAPSASESWAGALTNFLQAVEPTIGQYALVTSSRTSETANVPSSFLNDLLALRQEVEQLSEERDALRSKLNESTAVSNTLRALSPGQRPQSIIEDSKDGMSGVVQRLVAKEKEVLQLRKEISALQASGGRIEDAETAKKERAERNRQWTNLMEEISKNKAQLADLEAIIEARDKEIKYLKRALESVYTRFQAHMAEADAPKTLENGSLEALDASIMASRTIEALAKRDEEITELKNQVSALTADLRWSSAAIHQSRTNLGPEQVRPPVEHHDKASTSVPAPPPPPPPPLPAPEPSARLAGKPAVNATSLAAVPGFAGIRVSRPAPNPPEPPTLLQTKAAVVPTVTRSQQIPTSSTQGIPPPPPPPPPSHNRDIKAHTSTVPTAPPVPGASKGSAGLCAGVPPPPPPPFALSKPAIKVTASPISLKPRVKLKPFFWNKVVSSADQETVWNTLREEEDLDLSDVIQAFAAAPTKIAPKATLISTKAQSTSVLPLQRAQNIAIMLARMRLSHAAIRDAVLQVDDRKMTIDRLKPLRSFVPTTEEANALADYKGDVTLLSASDQFMRLMITIPRLGERLSCMMTRRRFEMDLEELRPELSILRNAADEIKASSKLKAVLKVVRAIGNTLNATTFRGNAQGFQLDALLKLRDTRATSATGSASTSTLLHYTVRLLKKQDDSLTNFLSESPHVHAASRISAANLASSVSSLNQAIAFVKQELEILRRIGTVDPSDRFVPAMLVFIEESNPAMLALNNMSQQLDEDLTNLLRYFGEDPSSTKPEDFFGIISSFAIAVQKAEDEIRDADRLANKGMKGAKAIKDGKRSIGRGQFDEALRDLRSGGGIRRARQEASVHRPRSRIMLDGARR